MLRPYGDDGTMTTHVARADALIDRLLYIRYTTPATAAPARRALGGAVVFTAVRCTLMYILLPFGLPLVGFFGPLPHALSAMCSVIALVALVLSIRRFWAARYAGRWRYLPAALTMIAVSLVFLAYDVEGILQGN